eukprot:Hpha_TRINITY_DN16802_c2_g4::TRINITY_DN16802_c2_g4_i2::g.151096::m.151096
MCVRSRRGRAVPGAAMRRRVAARSGAGVGGGGGSAPGGGSGGLQGDGWRPLECTEQRRTPRGTCPVGVEEKEQDLAPDPRGNCPESRRCWCGGGSPTKSRDRCCGREGYSPLRCGGGRWMGGCGRGSAGRLSSLPCPPRAAIPSLGSVSAWVPPEGRGRDGLVGGSTRFLREDEPIADVQPVAGKVIVFEHTMRHTGEEVLGGMKRIIRTEVMFEPPDGVSPEDLPPVQDMTTDAVNLPHGYLAKPPVHLGEN